MERFRVYRTRKGSFVLHTTRMPDWAAWSDSGAWSGGWGWDISGSGEHGGGHEGAAWWWGPAEETLDVADTLEELREHLPADFYDTLSTDADRPAVEDLDI